MNALIHTIREYPEIALYLTLALGFSLGTLKIGKFSLGIVTTTLIAGLVVGQIGVHLPSVLQSTFFAMFLFAVGYSVGPQFIRALRSDGLPQVFHAIIVCASGLATAFILGKVLHYDVALTTGLLSGGYTNSTVLGVGTNLIAQMGMSPTAVNAALTLMPVAYAVTYPFGTAGSAWVLSNLAPKIFKFDLAKSCKEYEEAHGKAKNSGNTANIPYGARVFEMTNSELAGKTVSEIERALPKRVFIRRMRLNAGIVDCQGQTVVPQGAALAVSGASVDLVQMRDFLGQEVSDTELLDFTTEEVGIVVTQKSFAGKTLAEIRHAVFERAANGVFVTALSRGDVNVPMSENGVINRGDVLRVIGRKSDVAQVTKELGYADRQSNKTDIAFMGFGIVIGSLIGAITVHIAGIPFSLSTAVGAIIAGILCGWMRTSVKSFGQIPGPALWVFNNLGLNGFIAIIGLNAATGFVSGLAHYGLTLFVAGMIVTIVPLIVGLVLGHYVFKFHPGILVGACAGARSTTAAIGAVIEVAKSEVPAVGYTVGYAVSRFMMAIFTIVLMTAF